jgi:hypothetical protein
LQEGNVSGQQATRPPPGVVHVPLPMETMTYGPPGTLFSVGLCRNGGATTSFFTNGPSGDLDTACAICELVPQQPSPHVSKSAMTMCLSSTRAGTR